MNIKIFLSILSALVISSISIAQPNWGKSLEKNNTQTTNNGITKDANSNIITAGVFSGSIDLDPGPGTNIVNAGTGFQFYVSKLDSNGNYIWGKTFGSGSNKFLKVTSDVAGNIYIGGLFQGTVDFDPSALVYSYASAGGYDNFVMKLDSNGNFKYAQKFGNNYNDDLKTIEVNTLGELYAYGNFFGTLDMNPGIGIANFTSTTTNTGRPDIFLVKLDTAGDYLNTKILANGSIKTATGLHVDAAGSLYLLGNFSGTIDMNPGAAISNFSAGTSAYGFINKLDSNGNFKFARAFQTPNTSTTIDVTTDANYNIYAAGTWNIDSIDLNPGAGTFWVKRLGGINSFITKLDSLGNFVFGKSINGSPSEVNIHTLNYDNFQNIYCSGNFKYNFNTTAGVSHLNISDASSSSFSNTTGVVCRMDTNGNYAFVKKIGTDCMAVANPDGSLYATGMYTGLQDLDLSPSVLQAGAVGITIKTPYILKHSFCSSGVSASDTISNCDTVFVNNTKYTNSGTYFQTYGDANGCDSIVPYIVTVKSKTTNTITATACDSFYFNGAFRIFSGNYKDTFVNANGCDSILTLQLTIKYSTSKNILVKVCIDTTINGITYSTNGTYNQTLTNAVGCDSFLKIIVTINDTTPVQINRVSCKPDTFLGQVFTSTTSQLFMLQKQNGCDSFIQYNYTRLPSKATTINKVSCNDYLWNGISYNASGVYLLSQHNSSAGCDSLVYLNLTVQPLQYGLTQNGNVLTAVDDSASYQWIRCSPFSIINGAVSKQYTATQNGDYAVILSRNGCVDTSNCVMVAPASITDLTRNPIQVYPNPASKKVIVELLYDNKGEIHLYNAVGQKIKSIVATSRITTIQLEDIAAGVYQLRVGNYSTKLIVE
jgi:hypothetical protein